MQSFSIPACYFPTTTLFVDDGCDFLLKFAFNLEEELTYRIFDSPLEALAFIHTARCELESLNQRCNIEYQEAKNSPLIHPAATMDLAAIHAEVYNPKRFAEISVIVVDYSMPGMDALEFCQHIENPHIKKILLITESDEKLAINALNQGIIQAYIQKNNPQVEELLLQKIHDLQLQYFQSMSDIIVRTLSVSPPKCLYDRQFVDLFWQICKRNRIVEFYLADNSGSFCMFDLDANMSFLMVKSEGDMRLHYDLAVDAGVGTEELDQLLQREKIPCFWHSTKFSYEDDWSNCLVPAKKCLSTYYAFIQGAVLFDVRLDKILSYRQYIEVVDEGQFINDIENKFQRYSMHEQSF